MMSPEEAERYNKYWGKMHQIIQHQEQGLAIINLMGVCLKNQE